MMIPNGVNREVFTPRTEGSPTTKTRILFVGRLTEQKGVTYIIDAVNKILKTRSAPKGDMACDIIGDGPLREVLEKKVMELGLSDTIKFHGWVPREKLPSFYQNADLFILPSSDEGMPNVVLEAMASGLPIITTFVPGSEELVVAGENGMLVKDRTNLVPAILDFLDNREKWKAMGRASLERSKKFDWAKIAVEYANLI
ncbi:MAG: glycosyltransferase family 4 protein [Patescibacteria group bacterium]